MADVDRTPTFIAYCPTCGGFLAAAVADVGRPAPLEAALKDRQRWVKAGLNVQTQTVQDVRDYPEPLGHRAPCQAMDEGRG